MPIGAISGPISLVTRAKVRSKATATLAILPPPPPAPNPELTPAPRVGQSGGPRIETGTSRTKAFVGARRAVTFSFRVSGRGPLR